MKVTAFLSSRFLKPALACWLVAAWPCLPLSTAARPQVASSEILAIAVDKGKQAIDALRGYTYYAELTLETVSDADVITGRFNRFSKIYFDEAGNRQEKIFETTSTLPDDVRIGTNAANNLIRVYQFMVTPDTLASHEFTYVGREKVDELNTYVFDVRPKVKMPDPAKSPERYLKGRVWIDDQDFLVVKVAGEAVPEQGSHRTPKFETIFQNYGKWWFPAYTAADDDIRVGRKTTRVIAKVRFTSYQKVEGVKR